MNGLSVNTLRSVKTGDLANLAASGNSKRRVAKIYEENIDRSEENLKVAAETGLVERIQALESHLVGTDVSLHFEVDLESGENRVKLINRDTGEVIRQVPEEDLMDLERGLNQKYGLLLNRQI